MNFLEFLCNKDSGDNKAQFTYSEHKPYDEEKELW